MGYVISYFDLGIFNILFVFLPFRSEPKNNLGVSGYSHAMFDIVPFLKSSLKASLC